MISPDLARRVKLLVVDVDGVLTDNGVYIGPIAGQRVELKRFHIQDGLGMTLLRDSTIDLAWLSGRFSEATILRATELRIPTLVQETGAQKVPALTKVLDEKGLDWSEVAYVGDDLADIGVMQRVGLPIAVANAVPEVMRIAHWVTEKSGGQGAVREVIEGLLKARGEWESVLTRYLATRGN